MTIKLSVILILCLLSIIGSSTCRYSYAFQIPSLKNASLEGSASKDGNKPNHETIPNRRETLKTIGIVTAATISQVPLLKPPPQALAAQTAGEAIRRSAANMPGYGQADLYYPTSFLGKWKATRIIVSSSDLGIPQSILPLTISYDIRFMTVDGDIGLSGDNNNAKVGDSKVGKVIADRQFNEESYYNALRELLGSSSSSQLPSIRSTSWSSSNPNVLTISYNDGAGKEVKVTKRAADMDESNGIISSSEYRRISTVASGTLGVPSIEASRIMNKWKINETGVIEGIEVVYSDGVLGDPMAATAGAMEQQQQLSSKSRLRLER